MGFRHSVGKAVLFGTAGEILKRQNGDGKYPEYAESLGKTS
jgi:hypothetical protein